jgi:hypothetical protein
MININASEVAALVGKNPYKDPEEAIQNVLNRNVHRTPSVEDQKTRDICNSNKEARRLHQEMVANSRITKSTDQVDTFKQSYHENIETMKKTQTQEIKKKSKTEIETIEKEFSKRIQNVKTRGQKTTLALEQRLAVLDAENTASTSLTKVETDMNHMKNMGTRQTNTEFGTRHEGNVADMYHQQTGRTIQKDDARKTMEFLPGFQIVGRFDGFNDEGTLIEIKNRMRRLFKTVPEYENTQVHVYMKMSGVTHAQLVERYQDQIMVHDVTMDDDFMEEIMTELKDVCRSYFS